MLKRISDMLVKPAWDVGKYFEALPGLWHENVNIERCVMLMVNKEIG